MTSPRAGPLIPGLDRSAATHLAAVMLRSGLHDLHPYESPDHGYVDPLDDKGLQACIRQFLGGLYREAMEIANPRERPLPAGGRFPSYFDYDHDDD